MKAVDLFCGYGGWAEGLLAAGFEVDGYDIEPRCAEKYPGRFHLADVRNLDGRSLRGASVIVASPPCQRFSSARASRKVDPPTEADLDLCRHAMRIIRESGVSCWAIENVQGAVPWFSKVLGPPRLRKRPFYLWGEFPGFLIRQANLRKMGWAWREDKQKWYQSKGDGVGRDPRMRAKLPRGLTEPFAEAVAQGQGVKP